MEANLEVEGFNEARDFLKGLEEKAQRRILLSSLRIAGRPLVKQAKILAPVAERNVREFWGKRLTVPPETLKKSIKFIVPKRKSDTLAELFVGPKKIKPGRKRGNDEGFNKTDAWFRHFVIRGTAGFTIKSGKNKGRFVPGQEANPFMDDAYKIAGSQVETELKKSVTDGVQKYCKRKGITFLN